MSILKRLEGYCWRASKHKTRFLSSVRMFDESRVSSGTQLVYKRLHIALKRRMHLDADDILPQSLLWKKTRKASTRAAHIEYARSASVA